MIKYLAVGNAIDPQTGKKEALPWEYQAFVLCRDVYHCTPSQLAQEDQWLINLHIEFINLEHEYGSSSQ